jgi:hypothetical protein
LSPLYIETILACLVYFDVYVLVPMNHSYTITYVVVLQYVFCQSVFEDICGVGGTVDYGDFLQKRITRRTLPVYFCIIVLANAPLYDVIHTAKNLCYHVYVYVSVQN